VGMMRLPKETSDDAFQSERSKLNGTGLDVINENLGIF
jgi:hypothetical protein